MYELQLDPANLKTIKDHQWGRMALYHTGKQSRSFANATGPEKRLLISDRVCSSLPKVRSKESVHEIYHRRELAVACWAVQGEWAVTLFKPGREDQCGKIGAVVNVEVREQDHIELGHCRATLSESKSAATTSIY